MGIKSTIHGKVEMEDVAQALVLRDTHINSDVEAGLNLVYSIVICLSTVLKKCNVKKSVMHSII